MDGPRPSIREALEQSDVIWLSSVRPERRPHVLPMWFSWGGASIMAFSKPHAQEVRNLRLDPSVMYRMSTVTTAGADRRRTRALWRA